MAELGTKVYLFLLLLFSGLLLSQDQVLLLFFKFHEMLKEYLKNIILLYEDFIYLFLERGLGKEREQERNIKFASCTPPLGTWPATQACALTGNWTGDPLVQSGTQPLSHTSQGKSYFCKLACLGFFDF